MSEFNGKPLVGVPVSLNLETEGKTGGRHITADSYVRTLAEGSGVVPVLIPALGDLSDCDELVHRIDGLLLTGGRSNVEPHHYNGRPFPDDEIRDPARDATVLPLIRACIAEGIPVFGICRGIQEINVAMGGTLHYRIHELPGKMDHRMPRTGTREEKYRLRHAISLAPGGVLEGLAGGGEVMVNSLHGQGIDRPAAGFDVEALAPDGVIEAISMPAATAFTVGVQWHAEWRLQDHPLARSLFEAFGAAAREHAARKGRRLRVS